MASDALRSSTSLCRGGLDAANAAALVLARANLASCTVTGGSGRASRSGEIFETCEVAGGVVASRRTGENSASISLWFRLGSGHDRHKQSWSQSLNLGTDLYNRACVGNELSFLRHVIVQHIMFLSPRLLWMVYDALVNEDMKVRSVTTSSAVWPELAKSSCSSCRIYRISDISCRQCNHDVSSYRTEHKDYCKNSIGH